MNFNEFTNFYRVAMVKRMIEQGEMEKYSVLHLYTKAGFRSQSTFNENFKKFTGTTPKEYRQRTRQGRA